VSDFMLAGVAVFVLSAAVFVASVIQLVRLRRWTGQRPIKPHAGSWAPLRRRGTSDHSQHHHTKSVAPLDGMGL
jgi:hypothetical protein